MGVELGSRRGRVPLQPRHDRRRRDHGRLRRRPHHERAEPPDRRGARRRARRWPRRRALPPRASSTATCASCPADWADAECVPPHDLTGQARGLADRPGRARSSRRSWTRPRPVVRDAAARGRLGRHPDLALGPGRRPRCMPRFAERFGVDGRLSSAVDLVRGLGVLTGHRRRRRPGRDRRLRQRLRRPARGVPRRRSSDRDFFLLHVEATDEAGHQNAVAEKVAAARAVGRRDHRPARRRARRRAVPGAAPARPRHAVRADDPHVRSGAVPPLRLDGRRPRAGATPSPASPTVRWSSPTTSWPVSSPERRGPRVGAALPAAVHSPDPAAPCGTRVPCRGPDARSLGITLRRRACTRTPDGSSARGARISATARSRGGDRRRDRDGAAASRSTRSHG